MRPATPGALRQLARYQTNPQLGLPYYVLLGTCDDGYRTLRYEEATEQGRQRTYDADGRMVYDRFDGVSLARA